MDSAVQTGWVQPPKQIGGLDHLGAQAPCIKIYSQLLPGITNVTDRARYYSFYPWVFTEFDRNGWRAESEWAPRLRRAECLLTLIAHFHSHTADDDDEHGDAMVGSNTLDKAAAQVAAGATVRLSDFAHQDSEQGNRYFKNPYGGLGQYYFGVLEELGLLQGESVKGLRVIKETGKVLALAVSKHVPGEDFIRTLEGDVIDAERLRALSAFCFCNLKRAAEEAEYLIGVFAKGLTALHPEYVPSLEEAAATTARAQSLSLLCNLADQAADADVPFDVHAFSGMIYSGCNPASERLRVPDALQGVSATWQVYQRNELLAVALQGLLHVQVKALEVSGERLDNTRAFSDWFWQESLGHELLSNFPVSTAADVLQDLYGRLPQFALWQEEGHEITLMREVGSLAGREDGTLSDALKVLRGAMTILSALILRPENQNGYGEFAFPPGYLQGYPVNLNTLPAAWRSELAAQSPAAGFAQLCRRFCLDAHLRVAMRKLRQQGQNTFRFIPGEMGITVRKVPAAPNTSPRFTQAVRILTDLGLLQRANGLVCTTARGRQFEEQVNG
ncbi:hypothetical protein [uncultured Microbulbifer sp.]|uniref:hypothetical protein n=1 Tax=uncultured Microbulbifer sp. TaxID=348147 RepID=UPI0025E5E1CC|nr:hypothetical protein [uncultured Microbulbifer sp.]